MIFILLSFFVVLSIMYSALILNYTYYFKKSILRLDNLYCIEDNKTKVTVIIACRNESKTINNIIGDLNNQSYAKDLFQVIIVDDASVDNTYELALSLLGIYKELNLKVIRINEDAKNPTYKKFAISKAIQYAEGELILTTDADCRLHSGWIKGYSDFYVGSKAKMIVGIVAYHNDDNMFEKLQHLEFLSLIASGMAAIDSGYPVMCNGANLAYQKSAFLEVNGFESNNQFASGDDVFLLLKIKRKYGSKSIATIYDKSSLVYTVAKKSFKGFVNQRLRWASKTKGFKDFVIIFVAGIVYSFNLCILLSIVLSFFNFDFIYISIILFVIKSLIDYPILYAITKFINRRDLLKSYILLAILYFPYFIIIGTLSSFASFKWKGRNIKN